MEYRFGDFVLDGLSRRLWQGEREVLLTPKAIEVLQHLVEHAGEVVEREALLEAVWRNTYVDDHALSVQVAEVRKALDDRSGKPKYVETRHRRGYRFVAEVIRQQTASPMRMQAPDVPAVAELPVPETRYARSGDVDIAYQVIGDGPVDLVFVMGWVSHLEYFWKEPSFARFLRRLASFSRLILFDKRGTGLSDRVPIALLPSLELRMDDVRAVMDAVGSQRAAICGVSEGGPLSALFAATYPEKTLALVMIGTYAKRVRDESYPWGPTIEEREAFFEEIHRRWGGPVGIESRAPSLAEDARFRDWWATYLRMGASPGAAIALTKMNAEIDVRQVLGSIRVPTLVLHRSGDQCLTVDEGRFVASLIPGARFLELPGADHLPFVGDQNEILDPIEDFVTGMRYAHEPERVLSTVLAMRCEGAAEGLRDGILRELEWYRGSLIDLGAHDLRVSFDGPARAVRCAIALARTAGRAGCVARVGVHTGECDTLEGKIQGGPAVEMAMRIAGFAPARQVLISNSVRDLVAGAGLQLVDYPQQMPLPDGGRIFFSTPHPNSAVFS